jgi:hypothetical protein
MKRLSFLLVLFVVVGLNSTVQAQNLDSKLRLPLFQEELDEEEEDERRGISFGLNLGTYLANKASAPFYSGAGLYSLNDNQAEMNTIESRLLLGTTPQQVQNSIGAEGFTVPFDSSPANMRYNPGLMVGFRTMFRFNNENAIVLDMNYANLKAADKFTLVTNLLPDNGQGTEDIRVYNIIGEEDRLALSLGYRTGLVINETSNWFFGFGAAMTAVRLNANYLEIEGNTYDLWVGFVGPNNFNGPTGNLTGTGFGFYGDTGVELFFADKYEAHLGMKLSRDRIVMGSFDDQLVNTQIFFTVSI